jgi:glucose 1-dehydrogenase
MRLDKKVAMVTGAASGIGRAIALAFLKEGAAVAAIDLTDTQSEQSEKVLTAKGDISDPAIQRRLLEATLTRFGRVDILVNNAGMRIKAPFLEATSEAWDSILDVNLKAPYFLAQQTAKTMMPGGRIINIASVHDERPHAGNSIYSISKAGIKMLTKALARELAERGILVNAISPGAIETGMNRDVLGNQEARRAVESRIPLGRVGCTEDIAKAAIYLASRDSEYVTGATIYVDGGLLLN